MKAPIGLVVGLVLLGASCGTSNAKVGATVTTMPRDATTTSPGTPTTAPAATTPAPTTPATTSRPTTAATTPAALRAGTMRVGVPEYSSADAKARLGGLTITAFVTTNDVTNNGPYLIGLNFAVGPDVDRGILSSGEAKVFCTKAADVVASVQSGSGALGYTAFEGKPHSSQRPAAPGFAYFAVVKDDDACASPYAYFIAEETWVAFPLTQAS